MKKRRKKSQAVLTSAVAIVAGGMTIGAESCAGHSFHSTKIETDSLKLEQRLKEISLIKFKETIFSGAMCYEIVAPAIEEYNCSICNSKTELEDYTIWSIASIRGVVQTIKESGYDVILDESEFCPHCSGGKKEYPELIFKIRYSPEGQYHLARSNNSSDYACVLAFLQDKKECGGEFGETIPLSEKHVFIIQKMLGLGKDISLENK